MPIRNPFRKAVNGIEDENARPGSQSAPVDIKGSDTAGVSSPINIKDPGEYKLCEINDSGVYLPPSPPERKPFWRSRSNASTISSNHRSVLSENEPFNISRESFESYRRSFDISARSPVGQMDGENRTRQSLDSRRVLLPRSSLNENRKERPNSAVDEGFEDVGLNDDVKPKKRGIFGFGHGSENHAQTSPESNKVSGTHGFHFTGRKRGQSGQGSELGSMPKPVGGPVLDVKVDS